MAGSEHLELEHVTHRYGAMGREDATTAVADVSLSIRAGEFFTLVGPSGCGKTTTLRLVAGFEEPTAGKIRFRGVNLAGVPPEDRNVGVVFQNYALFPHLSVGENIAYGLKFTEPPGGGSREARVAELLELVDLAGMQDREPDSLSGGQQQRVALARALAPGPEVLLLDEPMSALDAELRERLRVQLRTIQDELEITTIYVTHDQEEALAISDRVAVMHAGRIEQIGTPREIYRRPASRFVAEFVGDNNVFAGEVVGVRDGVFEVAVGGVELKVGTEGAAASTGDRLTFCVRPERLVIDRETNAVEASVETAEFLGETSRVHLDWGGREVLVRTPDPLEGTVTVGFDPRDAHVVGVER